MKTSHFESGIALGAAQAADQRDEPTRREPATFNRHTDSQRLVGSQGRPGAGRRPRDGEPVSGGAS